jgi:hypothetical protein
VYLGLSYVAVRLFSLSASRLQVLTICWASAPSGCVWRLLFHVASASLDIYAYTAYQEFCVRTTLFCHCSLHFTLLSVCLRFLVIYGVFRLSVYRGTSDFHGIWGYFVRFLSSENYISEQPVSASVFGYLGMLHVYRLIPSVYGLFRSVRSYVLQVWYLSY